MSIEARRYVYIESVSTLETHDPVISRYDKFPATMCKDFDANAGLYQTMRGAASHVYKAKFNASAYRRKEMRV